MVHAGTAMVMVVMMGYSGPLGNNRGRYCQPGRMIIPVPLADALDRDHNEHAENEDKYQASQYSNDAKSGLKPGKTKI